jgi:hypothetical protein
MSCETGDLTRSSRLTNAARAAKRVLVLGEQLVEMSEKIGKVAVDVDARVGVQAAAGAIP